VNLITNNRAALDAGRPLNFQFGRRPGARERGRYSRGDMLRYVKTHWKLAAVIWLVTLCLPVFYNQPRGAVEGTWLFIAEVYGGFFTILLPAVFRNPFIEALPFSAIFLVIMSGALLAHMLVCSYLAHLLARRPGLRRLVRRLVDDD
jgi:hypothetical protein